MVQDEFNSDVNNIIGIYEDDLIDKYLVVDQELGLWKRKWSVCSPIDRPDTLASALISCDEERFPNIFCLMKIGCTLPITELHLREKLFFYLTSSEKLAKVLYDL